MDGKHTPGPWPLKVTDQVESGKNWQYVHFDGGPSLLTDPARGWVEGDPEREVSVANARLVVAAPDLLAACEASLSWMTSYPGGGAMKAYEQMRAAIAKATGVPCSI